MLAVAVTAVVVIAVRAVIRKVTIAQVRNLPVKNHLVRNLQVMRTQMPSLKRRIEREWPKHKLQLKLPRNGCRYFLVFTFPNFPLSIVVLEYLLNYSPSSQ
jgi:hypothetical protein